MFSWLPAIHPPSVAARRPHHPHLTVCVFDVRPKEGLLRAWSWLLFVVLKQRLCCAALPFIRVFFSFLPVAKTCLFSLIGAAHASVCVKHAVIAAPCDGFAVAGSGMDSLWCPVLVAALAGSLCSSPALADRKFGKQSFHLVLFYLRLQICGQSACPRKHVLSYKKLCNSVWASCLCNCFVLVVEDPSRKVTESVRQSGWRGSKRNTFPLNVY